MQKKIISLALVVALVAVMLTSFTLAYFTDKDQANNTFELGAVRIELLERALVNNQWIPIESPEGVATLGQLDPGVPQSFNKFVTTINREDAAYIRNYVAIETIAEPDGHEDDIYTIWFNNSGVDDPSEASGKYRHGAVIVDGDKEEATFENVMVGDKMFDIYVFDTINNAVVNKGESFGTLTTVALDSWVTNEMVEQLGSTFEIYTFSEAIQAAGFENNHAGAMEALIGNDADLEAHAIRLLTDVIGG